MRRKILSFALILSLMLMMTGGMAPVSAEEAPYEFSLYGNLALELKASDLAFFEELERQTNTKIDVQIPPSSNYTEALTIMMASMDYPDVVLFSDHIMPAYMDGVRNGVILPLNEYLEKAPNLMKYTYDVSWKTLKVLGDDNIYGIPRTSIARADGFMVRKDWMNNVGVDFFEEGKPLTLDQFAELLRKFTNEDPDGNGANDTYGLGQSTSDGILDVPAPISWAFGLIGWQPYEGEDYDFIDLKYSKNSDNYKRALEYTNMLWNEKLIDPDWPTVNTDAQNKRFEQSITGVRPEFAGWMQDAQTQMRQVTPTAELAYIVGVIEDEGESVQGGSFSTGFWGEWAIMSSAKDPQKIVDVFDYMLSDNYWNNVMYGLEGYAWNYDDNGNRIAIPDNGYAAGRAILRRNDAPGFFVGLNVAVEDRSRIENVIGVCIEQAVFSKDEGFRPAIADDPMYMDADREFKTSVSKIIVGDLPIDEFDSVLDKWYQNGGQTYIEQMNEGIKASQ